MTVVKKATLLINEEAERELFAIQRWLRDRDIVCNRSAAMRFALIICGQRLRDLEYACRKLAEGEAYGATETDNEGQDERNG